MKPIKKPSHVRGRLLRIGGGALLLLLLLVKLRSGKPAAVTDPSSGPQKAAKIQQETARPMAEEKTVLRPLPVMSTSALHEWTLGDGTSPEVMQKIAHNLPELIRLDEENARIQRRQLVYRKEPVWIEVEQSKATGQPLKTLTLPGLDGQEVKVEVTGSDLALSGMSGTFTGQIPGKDRSLVTLAFKQGREAFTVISPEDGIYLQGHPREPGEIIVTSFDPAAYLPFTNCEPVKTAQTESHSE